MGDLDHHTTLIRDIEQIVGRVLTADAIEAWWDTTIPALSLRSPIEVLEDGDEKELWDYVTTYLDPSFS